MELNKTNTSFKIKKKVNRPVSNKGLKELEPIKLKNTSSIKINQNFLKKKNNFNNQKLFGNWTLKYLNNCKLFPEEMLLKNKIIKENSILCCKFSLNDKLFICGDNDGKIYQINTDTLNKEIINNYDSNPLTSIRFYSNNEFLVTNSAGKIYNCKNKKLDLFSEEKEDIICSDYNDYKKVFMTGSKDCNIRIYNFENKKIIRTFNKGNWCNVGHTNRIFSVKSVGDIVYSGGWDGVIIKWDLRQKEIVDSIVGPMVSGDTIDIKNNSILVGSQKLENNLEIYDNRNLKKICDINFDKKYYYNSAYVYCCQFSKTNNKLLAGTSGDNFLSLFNFNSYYEENWRLNGFRKGIYTADFGNKKNLIGFGTGCENLVIMKY